MLVILNLVKPLLSQEQLEQQDQEQATDSENFLRPIKIEINNTLVEVRVDIRTLRSALSLPQHDMFHQGIYAGYRHPVLDADDKIEDIDHNFNEEEGDHQDNQQQESSQQANN